MNVATLLKVKGRAVATVGADTLVQDVAGKLAAKRIGAMVIVGKGGALAGIVSERDIIRALAARGAAALALSVDEIMTRDVVTCQEDDTIDSVMAKMTAGRFRHLPVVEDGSLVGLVSIGDVVKHHIAEVELEASALKSYLVAG
ncbi:MAG: CBS domain-containing protein [Hyphomicrobiaceae bacterium]